MNNSHRTVLQCGLWYAAASNYKLFFVAIFFFFRQLVTTKTNFVMVRVNLKLLPLPLSVPQSLCGNEWLHSGPQGPVHQQLHARSLPAPSTPVQLRRPVGPACHPTPRPLPSDPPPGAAADCRRRPGPSGDPHANRRRVSGRTFKPASREHKIVYLADVHFSKS